MPQPTVTDVHNSKILTNISVAYQNQLQNFIAQRVFPVVRVEKQTDKYYTYTKADWFRDEVVVRADGTESAGSGYGLSTATYSALVWALHKDIGDQLRANNDTPLSPDADATRFLTQRMMLRQEIQWVADYFTTSVWGTDLTPTNLWSNYATSDPVTDIETGKRTILVNTGYLPNTLVLGYDVWIKLRHHPDIVARIDGGATTGNPALVSQQTVAAVFGVDRILIAQAIKNTGLEGETASYGFTHGKHGLLCYTAGSPGLLAPSAGYTFVWSGVAGGLGTNSVIRRMRMDTKRADRIEIEAAWTNKVVASDVGYFFNGAVA